jgi:sugar O-acyltransferase (sialic acid O-acetyltransferase NeuD family)
MLIIGAGNLGKHILEILLDEKYEGDIVFFDEYKEATNSYLGKYRVINAIKEATLWLGEVNNQFVSAIGNNRLRERYAQRFKNLGGEYVSVISSKSFISPLVKPLKNQVIVQSGAGISNTIEMGEGCVIHANAIVGHDVKLGKYVSVATLTTLIGPCSIGDYSFIGTNCVVMPGVRIGRHVIVGACVKVDRDLADFETVI